MKIVNIVIYEDAVLSSVSGVIDLLMSANDLMRKSKIPVKRMFEIELISGKLKRIQLNNSVQFTCTKTIAEATHADIVIVPPFNLSADIVLSRNKGIIDWLQTLNLKKTEVASLCYGSYFLAEAGLLNYREATSHWMAIDDMKKRYPNVKILPDAIITDYNGIYTSGGAFSSLNLVLYLVEKFYGREIAIQLSKEFAIDIDRSSQACFTVFQGQRTHDDAQIHRAQTFIEKNYNRAITVDQIARHTNMSKRNFIRRFKDATKNNPIEYLQRVKIESAKKRMEKGERNILAIMDEVGYTDVKTFRSLFKRFTGLTPQEYAKKYHGF